MPVYHFTIHAYRNWSPGHPRGYTRRGQGYQPPDDDAARAYDEQAKQDGAAFDDDAQRVLVRAAHGFCQRRKMRLHGVGNEEGHVHYVLSWRGYADWHEVMRRLKNVLATELNRHFNSPGKRWFVRGGAGNASRIGGTWITSSRRICRGTRACFGARGWGCRSDAGCVKNET
jgi:hypothetical protein